MEKKGVILLQADPQTINLGAIRPLSPGPGWPPRPGQYHHGPNGLQSHKTSLGLSVTIGSVWIMSGIFLRTHSFPLRSLRVRLFYSDPLALLPLSLPGGRWRTNARAHHRAASRRARVPSLLGRFADDGIAMRAMDMDGADAPALFSGSRETVWAALPARPAALRRNPALRAGSSTSFQPQRLLFKAVK